MAAELAERVVIVGHRPDAAQCACRRFHLDVGHGLFAADQGFPLVAGGFRGVEESVKGPVLPVGKRRYLVPVDHPVALTETLVLGQCGACPLSGIRQ